MIQCSICSKLFANKRSLSSHKHRYHKNNSSTKKTNTEIMNSFEKVNSESYDTMPNTDEDTRKEILSDSIDNNHSTNSNMGTKKSESHDGEWETDYSSGIKIH